MEPPRSQNGATGPLPARQTWRPARRTLFAVWFAAVAIGNLVIAVLWSRVDGLELVIRVALLVLHLGIGAVTGWVAWRQSRALITADAQGIHVVSSPGAATYPWPDIAEIRPSVLTGRRTYLVLVRRDGRTIDLDLSQEHLDALQHWHQAAS